MKRWVATAAMLLALLGVLAAPAYADPPNIEPFPITCDGVTYTVVTPGQGNWTPALVTTSNQVLIPFSFHITVTNVATGEVVLEEEVSKAAASHAATTTCTFGDTFTEGGQTFVFEGVVEVLLTPPTG
jgi:hypothetical protein